MIILNNSNYDKHLLKIKLKGLKKGLSQQITENGKMTTVNDAIRQKRDMI